MSGANVSDPQKTGSEKVRKPRLRGVSVVARSEGVADPRPADQVSKRIIRKVRAYVALTKPRIIEQLLITTLPAMVLAYRGWPPTMLVVWTILGGALAAGAANTINMVIDRDIDSKMERTKFRPLVTGEIKPMSAMVFAITLQIASIVLLSVKANVLSAMLALSATLFYVLIYTMLLKRNSVQNIVIGGAAGAVPALVGWAAVENSLSMAPWILFGLVFLWTPPHFWALALRYKDDYRKADVPMMPVIHGIRRTTQEMLSYTVGVIALSLLLIPVSDLGYIYISTAAVSGAIFGYLTVKVFINPQTKPAMKLFTFSITYLTVLATAIMVDQLV